MAFTRMEIRHDIENLTVNDAWWDDSIADRYIAIEDGNVEDEYIDMEVFEDDYPDEF